MTKSNISKIKPDEKVEPLFQEFKWHKRDLEKVTIPGRAYANLAGKVRDITSGCATIMELIEFDYLQSTLDGAQPLMSDSERGNLTRIAIRSLQMLNEEAESGLDWAYKHHVKA